MTVCQNDGNQMTKRAVLSKTRLRFGLWVNVNVKGNTKCYHSKKHQTLFKVNSSKVLKMFCDVKIVVFLSDVLIIRQGP